MGSVGEEISKERSQRKQSKRKRGLEKKGEKKRTPTGLLSTWQPHMPRGGRVEWTRVDGGPQSHTGPQLAMVWWAAGVVLSACWYVRNRRVCGRENTESECGSLLSREGQDKAAE